MSGTVSRIVRTTAEREVRRWAAHKRTHGDKVPSRATATVFVFMGLNFQWRAWPRVLQGSIDHCAPGGLIVCNFYSDTLRGRFGL